jgi:septal ring factor EnvC (AmiA/AmiB activator)
LVLFFKKELFLAFLAVSFEAQATPRTDAAARLAQAEQQRAATAATQSQSRRDLAAAEAQAARLADARARQAAALRTVEAGVLAAAADLREAKRRQARIEADLAATERNFAALLPVMLRVSRLPEEAVLAAPVPAVQALRGLLVLRGMAVTLGRQAVALRAQQREAAAARAATARRAGVLAAEQAQQAARAADLDDVMRQARLMVTQAEADGRQAAQAVADAAAQARTLRDAIAAMDKEAAIQAEKAGRDAARAEKGHRPREAESARARQAAITRPQGAKLAQSAGRLIAPVAGPVLRGFGAAAEDGPATGITYGTAPGAFVVSPCAGRVAFAAPFRSYGQLLIIECGGGYDIVLAGLGSLSAAPGHAAHAGEPVGRMGTGELYVEVREGGKPVDPAAFLTGKV